MIKRFAFGIEDSEKMASDAKIALLATVNPAGLPHITLITTIQVAADDPKSLVWGQFCEGQSKAHILKNPKTGFLVMTSDKQIRRGRAIYRSATSGGDEYDRFNQKPMFRYNSYFGIHKVHFMDLIDYTIEPLSVPRVALNSLLTLASAKTPCLKSRFSPEFSEAPLNVWSQKLFNSLSALKFCAYIDSEGYPVLVPLMQCQASGNKNLIIVAGVDKEQLGDLPEGESVAVFGLTMAMENVLVRGRFTRVSQGFGLLSKGRIEVDWVYNSMPPTPGQIYPPQPMEEITVF